MNIYYKILLIVVFLIALFSLGQGLYFLMTDKHQGKRTVGALARRIGFSVLLIVLIIIGIVTGLIHPHALGQ